MLFTTPLFLFAFLPACVLAYFASPRSTRNIALLLISFAFYFWGEPWFILVVLLSAFADFGISLRIAQQGRNAFVWLTIGVVANLALLVGFKYGDFLLANLAPLVGPTVHLGLLLPLGISFIVFEKITYLVDVYRGTCRVAATASDYLLFVFFFPKMLAGPIIKYHEIETYLRRRLHRADDFAWGLLRFTWGLSKKVLVADVCGNLADAIFAKANGTLGFATAWIAVLAFTTQIYYDFSGYSDMAIGLARVFGFRLRENFNHPYGSASFTEFWRRWHISLSTWIKDYLYIPLGGNRGSAASTTVNLWTCFLLSGLWHGAAWHFVLWGAWNGIFLTADKLFWLRWERRLPKPISVLVTLFFIMLGWVIFRCETLSQLHSVMEALFSPGLPGEFIRIRADQVAAVAIGLGGALIASSTPLLAVVGSAGEAPLGRALAASAILVIGLFATAKVITVTFQPFLYFRF